MKDYEVVISGVSGAFPQCDNVNVLEKKLYTQENLVSVEHTKWKTRDIPWQVGCLNKIEHFDAPFFGIHKKLAQVIDKHMKKCLEKVYEAIIDSGNNPQDLDGTNTAVIINSNINEGEGRNWDNCHHEYVMLGYSRCMNANRVSYFFNFKGPSYSMSGSWDGAVQSLGIGYNMIKKGYAKAVIVGSTNILSYPHLSQQYNSLTMLNDDGMTKSFSANANGYSRSEGIVVFVLQRADDAIRSYGSIAKVLSQTHMNNNAGIIDPRGYSEFLGEFYSDVPIKTSDLAYVEGNGSALLQTDAMELNAMSEILCPGRTKPLPVTCCKSKLGHCESSSSFVALVSALIAMKTGFIPPVLHFTKPNPLVPALQDGSLQIVTEKTPLEGGYVAVSSIGLVSGFGHILMKRNPKSISEAKRDITMESIPKVILLSGRDEPAITEILSTLQKEDLDDGFYYMNHSLYSKELTRHLYRGFSVHGENKSDIRTAYYAGVKRPVWYIFSGMGSQWLQMGKGIMKISIMRESIERSHRVLESKGIDLITIVTTLNPRIFDCILHSFVGIASIQIALVDLLEELGIIPDGMVGHSVGELGCAYADKCLTAEQMILAAYYRGKASLEASLINGMMAAVGKGWKEIHNELPEGIEVACHNSDTSCTLSGPADIMKKYVDELKNRGVFAKLVNVANIAYHSKNIAPAGPLLLEYLRQIIPEPKKRSSKWISSSLPESEWESDLALYCSAEYQTNNLLSHVLFEEAATKIPQNAVCIEIAPHGLLQAIVKKSLPECSHIPMTKRAQEGCFTTVHALALMFSCGIDMDLSKLYPKMECPLPRETEYLHHLVTWNSSDKSSFWSITNNLEEEKHQLNRKVCPTFNHPYESMFISLNHRLNGNATVPSASILCRLVESLADELNSIMKFNCFNFQNINFIQNLIVDQNVSYNLDIVYLNLSGKFEISNGMNILMNGEIHPQLLFPKTFVNYRIPSSEDFKNTTHISSDSIYRYFEQHEYVFTDSFRNIIDVNISDKGFIGRVKWAGNGEFYLDAVLKLIIFYFSITQDCIMEIENIDRILYDPTLLPEEDKDVFVIYDENVNEAVADGLIISSVKTIPDSNAEFKGNSQVEKQVFVPYSSDKSLDDFIEECFQIVVEYGGCDKIHIIGNDKSNIFQSLVNSNYYKTISNTKENIIVTRYDENQTQNSKKSPDKSDILLIISDDNLSDMIQNFTSTLYENYYLICRVTNGVQFKGYKKLVPVSEHTMDNFSKIVFCKKKINPFLEGNYIQLPEGCLLDKPDSIDQMIQMKKSHFYIFKYRNISDIKNIIESSLDHYSLKNTRFVFIDDNLQQLDLTNDLYMNQLKKDFKINVRHKGMWGSIRQVSEIIPVKYYNEIKENQQPLQDLRTLHRTDSVDVQIVGLNMQSFANPTCHHQFGLIDYVGIGLKNNDIVMGIGKLTNDNVLLPDPILVWKKPECWTMQQAATIPLFYSLAYYTLQVKVQENKHFEKYNILIHGGHTAFSKAFIDVGLSMKGIVHTTCFSLNQKISILKRFPELKESDVYIIDDENKLTMMDHIIDSMNGKHFDIVIDCLEDKMLTALSIKWVARLGQYFLICNNNTSHNNTISMGIFGREISAKGVNVDLLWDLKEDKKEQLVKLVQEGIDRHEIRPLPSLQLDHNLSRREAIKSIVSSDYKQEEIKKCFINLDKKSKSVKKNKNYLIVDNNNSLWIDLMYLLSSGGAKNIYVYLDQSRVSEYAQMRLNVYLKNNSTINICLQDIKLLKTKGNFQETLCKVESLDNAFYISSKGEDMLEALDAQLSKLFPDCCLVHVGSSPHKSVTEKRKRMKYKMITFILKKASLKVETIISALNVWTKSPHQYKYELIHVNDAKQDAANTLNVANDPDILPQTIEEIAELAKDSVDKPHFTEVSTKTLPKKYTKEIDPAFFFPGFKVLGLRNLISKLSNPAYIARYPSTMASLDEVAEQFSKELVKNFDLYMFTLVAEGWSGPLALKVANQLEKEGKTSSVILIDASPASTIRWAKSNSVIVRHCLSPNRKNEEKTIDELKECRHELIRQISKEDLEHFSAEDVTEGLDALINRLELMNSQKELSLNIGSKIHLFTPRDNLFENHYEIAGINEMTKIPCSHHLVEDATSSNLLDSKQLLTNLNYIILQEIKNCGKRQNIARISTLDHITYNMFPNY